MKQDDEKDYEMLAFILNGSVRIRIYSCLFNQPKSYAYEIARIETINVSSVIRSLKELEARNVIKCLNPASKRRRFYKLTPEALKLKDDVLFRL